MELNRPDNPNATLQDLLNPEGVCIDEVILVNPCTGQVMKIRSESITQISGGVPLIVEREYPIVGICGCVIQNLQDLSFCGVSGAPVCRLHSVLDPFCGRIVSLPYSRTIEVNGEMYRVCGVCHEQITQAQQKSFWDFLFGD